MPKGKCEFKPALMAKYCWLKPETDKYYAKCELCLKKFNVAYGCEAAVKSHDEGEKHQQLLKEFKNSKKGLSATFFKKAVQSSSMSPSSSVPVSPAAAAAAAPTPPTLIDRMVASQSLVTAAELRMVLRKVKNHDSFRSCLDLGPDLRAMFPDSNIAAEFTLSKTKCSYLVKYGIAPWLKQNLVNAVNGSPFHSVSYDESLNHKLQEQQMDIQVRYWCERTNRAVTRYFGSEFQMHGDHETLSENILKAVTDLSDVKLIQTAMDGPKVNWKILDVIQDKRLEENHPPLEDIGSCGLHVISGALHTAVAEADWPVEKILRGMYKLLKDAPARRAEYMRVSTSGLYPEKFCVIHWVENEPVADRGIKVWSDFVELIKCFQSKPPSKRPKENKSYDNLVAHYQNPLIPVYLHLFRDTAARLNVFLVKFQTDAPMLPFLSEELAGILKWAMRFFIPKDILKENDTPYKLLKLKVNDTGIQRPKGDIKLTTSGEEELKKIPSNLQQGVKNSWLVFLIRMIEKIQERSPIKYKLVRMSACLDPQKMALLNDETLQGMFDSIVAIMFAKKRILSKQADSAKEQFEQFLLKVVALNKTEFSAFNRKTTRLDDFLSFYITPSYKQFWYVCQYVFTLNHGQSSVERGFNVNKKTMVENLEGTSLTSLRIIYDEIMFHGGKIVDFPIPNDLLRACQNSYMKYKNDLDRKKKESEKEEKTNKRKLLNEELGIVKKKKVDEEILIKKLKEDSNKFVMKAGDDNITETEMKTLVAQASSFIKSAKEKERKLPDYVSAMEKIEKEIKDLE